MPLNKETKDYSFCQKFCHVSIVPDAFIGVVKVTNYTEQWDAELTWYMPMECKSLDLPLMAKSTISKSTVKP